MAEDQTKYQVGLTDIKVGIAEIKVHMERSVPALEQVWKNKDDIRHIKTKQNLIVAIGSAIGLTTIAIAIRAVFSYFMKHPPSSPH